LRFVTRSLIISQFANRGYCSIHQSINRLQSPSSLATFCVEPCQRDRSIQANTSVVLVVQGRRSWSEPPTSNPGYSNQIHFDKTVPFPVDTMASPADYYQHQQPQYQRQQQHHPFQQQQQQSHHHHNFPPAPPPHQDRAPRTIPEEQVSYSHHYQEPPSPSKRRTFSFHSDKSQPRKGPVVRAVDLHETHAEKEAKRLHSKADPTLAMNEAEPSAVATMKTEVIVTPLRSLQHKDALGNAIAEPDKSNPTRHRWERPLETIRSFEAAIDGGYSRKSMYRAGKSLIWLSKLCSPQLTRPRYRLCHVEPPE
jgi:hypothetical protein